MATPTACRLESTEEMLSRVALGVARLVAGPRPVPVAAERNHHPCAPGRQVSNQRITIVGALGEKHLGKQASEQRPGLRDIVGLTG